MNNFQVSFCDLHKTIVSFGDTSKRWGLWDDVWCGLCDIDTQSIILSIVTGIVLRKLFFVSSLFM